MLDYTTEPEYTDYMHKGSVYSDSAISQYIEAEISRRTAVLKESYEKLRQDYQGLHDIFKGYYKEYIFNH